MCCSLRLLPGLALVAGLATVATLIGRAVPVVGAPVFALGAGALVGLAYRRSVDEDGVFGPGLEVTRQRVLGLAIVLLGLGLPFGAVLSVGRQTAVVLVGTVIAGAVAAVVVGRLLALDRESATLVAVGSTICGASAIAAATAVIKPDRERVAYALGTIFVFNVLAVLAFPPLGRLLGMSEEAFGLWAGTAINDTSSVLAAGAIFGPAAAQFAVIVKLVRSLLIVPMCVGLHLGQRGGRGTGGGRYGGGPRDSQSDGGQRSAGAEDRRAAWRVIPLFVVLFVAASVIAGFGLVPESWSGPLGAVSAWLIAAVLAAIGTSLSWQRVRVAGVRPLVFGGAIGLVLALSCLAIQQVTGWL
ncbi:YeiH family protein [Nocardia bhagyanarayanae]|uniref:Putative integral membrane protein (TIGR00698 family) n=1 Tax=Nocardia bhagyanarayanae TaxID=1215925 RepID=A0A543FCM5_9NOCA|nr:putative sulfate exporter family transporter [Nocardia bhagyanarayanae]TQM31635.1 putative integral membrane protein (TIGR00698 family) [Nocardia bhagyanarayanae]